MDTVTLLGTKPRRYVRMFQSRFAAAVQHGEKRRTIRRVPTRIPETGDIIDCRMWTGVAYRSPHQKLRQATITRVALVQILDSGAATTSSTQPGKQPVQDLEAFAQADGFPSWLEMRDWFHRTHGLPFVGLLIDLAVIKAYQKAKKEARAALCERMASEGWDTPLPTAKPSPQSTTTAPHAPKSD